MSHQIKQQQRGRLEDPPTKNAISVPVPPPFGLICCSRTPFGFSHWASAGGDHASTRETTMKQCLGLSMWTVFLSLCLFCPGSMAFAARVLVTGEMRPCCRAFSCRVQLPLLLCRVMLHPSLVRVCSLRRSYLSLAQFSHFTFNSVAFLRGSRVHRESHMCRAHQGRREGARGGCPPRFGHRLVVLTRKQTSASTHST